MDNFTAAPLATPLLWTAQGGQNLPYAYGGNAVFLTFLIYPLTNNFLNYFGKTTHIVEYQKGKTG